MASQSSFSFPQDGQSSPQLYVSGHDFSVYQRQIGGHSMNRDLSQNSTDTTESWDSRKTYGSSPNSMYDWEQVPPSNPAIKIEAMAYDNTFGTGYDAQYNELSRPSPRTEQADSFAQLSLDYPTTIQTSPSIMGKQFLMPFEHSTTTEEAGSFPSSHWSTSNSQYTGNISYLPSQPLQGSTSQYGYLSEQNDERNTPSSLGWESKSKLVQRYKLSMSKGKEPFLELKREFKPTVDSPSKVYFEQPVFTRKGPYNCPWPGECDRRKKPFGRHADLERHLKNVHAAKEEKDSFPCDYRHCSSGRHLDPFNRKDHYRDHLRDFHKEDIGACKGEKTAKDKRQWQQNQKQWLAERRIYRDFWRCARCLVKKYVKEDGWECTSCKITCEQERIDARMGLPLKEETPIDDLPKEEAQYFDQACNNCDGCQWVDNGVGGWARCIYCTEEPAQTGVQTWR